MSGAAWNIVHCLLVNYHDVTGRTFHRWISRQIGMKSWNGITNQEKNKGLLLKSTFTRDHSIFLFCSHGTLNGYAPKFSYACGGSVWTEHLIYTTRIFKRLKILAVRRVNVVWDPVQTLLQSCAEPNWWIKYGKWAASESIDLFIACMFCFPNTLVMCWYSRELFHSNFVLFTCISTHKLWEYKGLSSPGTSFGKTKHTS